MTDAHEDMVLRTPVYTITLPADRPYAYVDVEGRRVVELFLLSTADSDRGGDATTAVSEWQVAEGARESTLTLSAASSVWDRRIHQLVCTPERIEYRVTVEGRGALEEVTYFGGYDAAHPRWGAGLFHSGHAFKRGFNPEPDAAGSDSFDPLSESTIDLDGGPLPGRRHWFFTPAPFCFAFECGGTWVGLGLAAEPGAYRFTELRYRGGDGFRLTAPYDGRTRVEGTYRLPSVSLLPAESAMGALERHVEGLRDASLAPRRAEPAPTWWREPLFCGWGAQCHAAAASQGYRPEGAPGIPAFLAALRVAPDIARQDRYEGWLDTLAANGVVPGTIVIDDKWQSSYGENRVDLAKWPDLRGFVGRRHARGQRVLLWLKAWDREGVPDDECIRTAAGLPIAVDPTNPAYERRLRDSVRRMLSPEGYDADGFKIDFTHRIPTGPGVELWGDSWGLELMREYLHTIHDEAHRIKPDALVIAHAPHPYLADVVDMVRLNDMLDLTLLGRDHPGVLPALRRRAEVARVARPDAPIDTDNWPVPDKRGWREYVRAQPELGVPALYFAEAIDITQEALEAEDYELIREAWTCSRQR